MTISNLVYPERNPAGYPWAWAGILLCGLCGLWWASARGWKQDGATQSPIGVSSLRLGFFCMAFCAVLPERLVPVPKGHEILALTAFFSLCLGLAQLTFSVVKRYRLLSTHGSRHARLYAGLAAGGALAPILLAASAQAYVSQSFPELPWVSLSWRTLGVPLYLSFAFWEWITCAIYSAYIATLAIADALGEPALRRA